MAANRLKYAAFSLAGITALVLWHLYCSDSFALSTKAVPWDMTPSEVAATKAYFYWPPMMRSRISGMVREHREALQKKRIWGPSDDNRFLLLRRAELMTTLSPWTLGSEAEKGSRDADIHLKALSDTVSELDKRKNQ